MTSVNSASTGFYMPKAAEGTLKQNGNTIETPRYLIEVSSERGGTVIVRDKQTGEFVKAWGDPHFHTQDGNYGQFHDEALTLELDDGTKLTMTPTESDSSKEYVSSIAVMNGSDAVVARNINASSSSNVGQKADLAFQRMSSFMADKQFEDGTVLFMKDSINDLFFRADGKEFIGGSSTSSEQLLDGIFGDAALRFDKIMFPENASYFRKLAIIESFLSNTREETLDQLAGELNKPEDEQNPGTIKELEAKLQEINGFVENIARFRSSGIAALMQTANTIASNV